jgi:hypothetical protein
LNHNPIPINFAETGLKIFQQQAFNAAFAFLTNSHSTLKTDI